MKHSQPKHRPTSQNVLGLGWPPESSRIEVRGQAFVLRQRPWEGGVSLGDALGLEHDAGVPEVWFFFLLESSPREGHPGHTGEATSQLSCWGWSQVNMFYLLLFFRMGVVIFIPCKTLTRHVYRFLSRSLYL